MFAETQTWRCFGCNEGGDIFSFVQKQQGLDFRETLHYLAEKAGVQVEDYASQNPEEAREATALKERLRKLARMCKVEVSRLRQWLHLAWALLLISGTP